MGGSRRYSLSRRPHEYASRGKARSEVTALARLAANIKCGLMSRQDVLYDRSPSPVPPVSRVTPQSTR